MHLSSPVATTLWNDLHVDEVHREIFSAYTAIPAINTLNDVHALKLNLSPSPNLAMLIS